MENKKKRIVAQEVRGKKGDRFEQYQEEFEYLISSGIALAVHAITNPHFPLSENDKVTYIPVYLVMFMEAEAPQVYDSDVFF